MPIVTPPSPPAAARPGPDRPVPVAPPGPAPTWRLPHFAALDGLRGVAIIAVLAFHGPFPWATGGFLGVSTFFTLSGFLITSLLLAERGATGRIDLARFSIRRARRLVPAALAALTLALVFTVVAGDELQRRNLAGDVVACLAYVANWRFLLTSQSYLDSELFRAPSPVLHFWSIAIEGQFYLLFPALGWFVLQHQGRSRRWFGGLVGVLIAASVACSLVLGLSHEAIYLGTETRAAELLVGALLAVGLYHRRVTATLAHDSPRRTAIIAAAALGLVALAASWVLVDEADQWLYQGGFALYAVASALVIVGAITPAGPVRWLLSIRPLTAIGRISYGVYLFHWPVFLWISEARTGWSTPVVMVPRLMITFGLAILSYRYVESPIRRGAHLLGWPTARLVPVATAVLVVAVIAVSTLAPKSAVDYDAIADQLHLTAAQAPPPKPIDPTSTEPPFPRMAVFGDSTALMTGLGLSGWSIETHRADVVEGSTPVGCGIGRGGERRRGADKGGPISDICNRWERTYSQKIKDSQPNIAVVQIGPWEAADRKLEGDDTWRSAGDPVYDAYLLKEMVQAVDTLSEGGAEVMWLTSPAMGKGESGDVDVSLGPSGDPARFARINELIQSLPQARPGKVHVLDLAGWLAATDDDVRLRPDGEHFGPDEAKEVAQRWLGPAIVDAYTADWRTRTAAGTSVSTGPDGTTAPDATVTTPTTAPTTTRYDGPKRKVLVLGDAAAQPIADGLKAWGDSTGTLEVIAVIQPLCGVLQTTERLNRATLEPTPADCEQLTFQWLQSTVAVRPDIVVMVPSVWDLTDVQLEGDTATRTFGDQSFEDALWQQFRALTDALQRTGTLVEWLSTPPINWGQADTPPPPTPYAASTESRATRYNEMITRLAVASGPALTVQKVDFASYASTWPATNPALRPNGVDVGADAAPIVGEWLADKILVDYDEFLTAVK